MMGLVEHARGRVRAGLQAQAVPSSLPGSGLPGFLLVDDAWPHVLVEHERLHTLASHARRCIES